MRVLHVITRLIVGGAQENTILTCQDLIRDHGDDVLLVSGPGIGPEGSLEVDVRGRGVPLEIVPAMRRSIHLTRDWQSYVAIRRIVRRFQPHVVHTHSGKAGLLGRVAARRTHVPVIVHTVHGPPFHDFQHPLARTFFRQCETFAEGRCDALVSVADAMTDRLVAAGVTGRDKCCTIYSGMELEPFLQADRHRARMRQQLGFRPDHIVVGKIARLFQLKGHDDLIEAAGYACRRCPPLMFLIVGDGKLRRPLERKVTAAGLADRFKFVGLVPPQRISELLAAMDLVVHTSLREGLARVLPQALLAGRPVISYDIDGAREVVHDGQTGFLVRAGQVTELAARICDLATSGELRHELATAGRALCAKRFDHHNMTQEIRDLYLRLCMQKKVPV